MFYVLPYLDCPIDCMLYAIYMQRAPKTVVICFTTQERSPRHEVAGLPRLLLCKRVFPSLFLQQGELCSSCCIPKSCLQFMGACSIRKSGKRESRQNILSGRGGLPIMWKYIQILWSVGRMIVLALPVSATTCCAYLNRKIIQDIFPQKVLPNQDGH